MNEVRIDRLVLDIPGMDAAAARELGLRLTEGLARSGASGDHSAAPHAVEAPAGETGERLAARILQSLLRRIG
jgi:hypothetical protein